MSSVAFVRFWQNDLIRDLFLSHTTTDDLKNLRLTCRCLAADVAPQLFKSIQIDFTVNTFQRRARLIALENIGDLARTVKFNMVHTEETFLPPLLDPETLQEVNFIYEPSLALSRPSSSCSSNSSKYGTWEMNDLLVRQYPPLFHAATNIPSFVRAFQALPTMTHLHISCPNSSNTPPHLTRRSIVDYALISIRLALESTNPLQLTSLTLSPIHPSAPLYLRPQLSLGCSPRSSRLHHRITTLSMTMTSVPQTSDTTHLKLLHTYLSSFSSLTHLNFTWLGPPGPCPVTLPSEPGIASVDVPPSPTHNTTSKPLYHQLPTPPPSPTTAKPPPTQRGSIKVLPNLAYASHHSPRPHTQTRSLRQIRWRTLRTMHIENAVLDADQAASFVTMHRKGLKEFDFNHCELRSGHWEDVLRPRKEPKRRANEVPKTDAEVDEAPLEQVETMDVPICFKREIHLDGGRFGMKTPQSVNMTDAVDFGRDGHQEKCLGRMWEEDSPRSERLREVVRRAKEAMGLTSPKILWTIGRVGRPF